MRGSGRTEIVRCRMFSQIAANCAAGNMQLIVFRAAGLGLCAHMAGAQA